MMGIVSSIYCLVVGIIDLKTNMNANALECLSALPGERERERDKEYNAIINNYKFDLDTGRHREIDMSLAGLFYGGKICH